MPAGNRASLLGRLRHFPAQNRPLLFPIFCRAFSDPALMFHPARFLVALSACALLPAVARSAEPAMDLFKKEIQPVLDTYRYGCHGGGIAKGGVTLDEFANTKELKDHALWLRALRNVRSGIMPPADEPNSRKKRPRNSRTGSSAMSSNSIPPCPIRAVSPSGG